MRTTLLLLATVACVTSTPSETKTGTDSGTTPVTDTRPPPTSTDGCRQADSGDTGGAPDLHTGVGQQPEGHTGTPGC